MSLSVRVRAVFVFAVIVSAMVLTAWFVMDPGVERVDATDICAGVLLGADAQELCVPLPI